MRPTKPASPRVLLSEPSRLPPDSGRAAPPFRPVHDVSQLGRVVEGSTNVSLNDAFPTNGTSPNGFHPEPDDVRPPPAWYVVRTRSRHEKKVRDQLLGRQVETFLPLLPRWSRWKDRTKQVDFPLFPGYCFARFPVAERVAVLSAFGVAGLVGLNGHPEPVPPKEIEDIRRLIASEYRYDPHPYLTEGMEVEVVRGPLAGVRGRLVRKDRSTKLVLSVSLIRQAAMVEIHPADVARI
jgi:transcription termination/antitermination protein NusG